MDYAIWNGPLTPYVRTTQRQKWVDPRYKKYQAFKDTFRLCLNSQLFPIELDKKTRYEVDIEISAVGKVRYDLDNGIKSVLDAAWKQDKQVKCIKAVLNEDEGVDFVKVILRRAK
jgi:Holliday junction resolvase RusA-like endonuclease